MRQKKPKPEEETKEFRIEKEELEALCARVAEGKIEPDDGPRLLRYLRLLLKLAQVLEHGRVRMRRLTRLLFGKRTGRVLQRSRPVQLRRNPRRLERGARPNPARQIQHRKKNPLRKGMAAIRPAPMRMRQRSRVRFAAGPQEIFAPCAARAVCDRWRRKSSSASKAVRR
jgi:hypothetical protein